MIATVPIDFIPADHTLPEGTLFKVGRRLYPLEAVLNDPDGEGETIRLAFGPSRRYAPGEAFYAEFHLSRST